MLPIAAVLVTAAALSCATAPEPAEIRFAQGSDRASVDGALARGERGLHAFAAREGQTATLSVTAPEGNAVFQLYAPGAVIGADGGISGGALPGADEGQDARSWHGALPASGRYLVVVGAVRGGTEYRLSLSIR
jgi:hypothetical protein